MLPLVYCIAGTLCATLVSDIHPDVLEKRRQTKALSILNKLSRHNFERLQFHVDLPIRDHLGVEMQNMITTAMNDRLEELRYEVRIRSSKGLEADRDLSDVDADLHADVKRVVHTMDSCLAELQQQYTDLVHRIETVLNANDQYEIELSTLQETCEVQKESVECYNKHISRLDRNLGVLESMHSIFNATGRDIVDEGIPKAKACFEKHVVELKAVVEGVTS